MRAIKTPIAGCYVVQFDTYMDDRGVFEESFHASKFFDLALPVVWSQDNTSMSYPGVLRGLHYQKKHPQAKLMRCLAGEIWDVCVDIRANSPTFGKYYAHVLNATNRDGFLIPDGCAHGFKVMGLEPAIVHYKCTTMYDKESDAGIRYDDPDLNIVWPGGTHKLSARDRTLPLLREIL